ncbi:hypothetical protein HOD75_04875 [archaeon]|jgi:hypothetical protein|nr:hypothetical protein [archaeon]MBT4242198.1 hypothetical protein [archaeon]MBT4417886.1 hypothetical protein [archaeon]
MVNKKGQGSILGLSFGTIFSIIIIVFILAVSGIVIVKFLDFNKCGQIGIFLEDFEKFIEDAWNSPRTGEDFNSVLPKNIEFVCFTDYNSPIARNDDVGDEVDLYKSQGYNLYFYPRKNTCEFNRANIPHLDIENITASVNPYCIAVNNGKIDIEVIKELNQRLVKVR